ncbi:MAG: dockerin type I domain-containing protein [Pseudomonadota bacterium]
MANEITSMLQPVMPRTGGAGTTRSGSEPTVVDSSRRAPGDRVSLTDSARLLQMAESKPGTAGKPDADSPDVNMTYSRNGNGFTGKGLVTTANGRQFTREVAMTFDPESQSVSRQVTYTGQNGAEVSRSTEITRTDKGIEAVTRRVGVQGNETIRETQVAFDPDNAAAGSADRLPADSPAQRPSPALANMMQSFFTTSDMEGFDASSDLNGDGVINFGDLAALRAIESGAESEPPQKMDPMVHNMSDSFFTSSGEQGFDATNDLNGDGMVNFQDLAILRSKMEGA